MNEKKKVLLIDGEDYVHEQARKIFKSYVPDLELISATDGAEGIKQAIKSKPHLILSEVALEEVDGFGVYNKIKQNPAISNKPFAFLTRNSIETRNNALSEGVDDYIEKPFKNKNLVQRANALINGEWRKYEGLCCLETPEENISIIIGEYNQQKPALDCIVARNGRIIHTQTIFDEQLTMIDELKETSRNKGKCGVFKLKDGRVLVGTYLKLKNPALYNCFTVDGMSFERNPTIGFLRNIAKLDNPAIFLPGYCYSKDVLEKYRLN